jgi:polar amino acid transport system substrate-binding protein
MIKLFLASCLMCILNASAATYTVGVENIDYYPHYAVRKGQYIGYSRDLLDKFSAVSGHQFTYLILPVKRLSFAFLKDHSIDFKFPDNRNWAPELRGNQRVIYSNKVIDAVEGAMVLPQRKGNDSAEIKILGTILGFTPVPYLEHIQRGTMRLSENNDFPALIQQTLLGRVDAAYINVEVGEEILSTKLHRPGALVFDPNLPNKTSSFSLSSIEHADIIEQFNKFLASEVFFQIQLCKKYRMKCAGNALASLKRTGHD